MPQYPEAILEGKRRPFTGSEFLESLRDGREVYIYGEQVEDVTTHPAFRNAAVSVAQLYDALHDPKTKDVLTAMTDTGSGGYTHKFFKAAHSREDVIAQRDAIAAWARISYGWMGRSPDYKAAFLNTLGANAEFYEKFADNARAWHKRAQEAVRHPIHRTIRTGILLCASTSFTWLPSRRRPSARRPCEAITIRSQPFFSAIAMIPSAGCCSGTWTSS
jgi:4-hydroxyphenylacetate 3-monooxygenase